MKRFYLLFIGICLGYVWTARAQTTTENYVLSRTYKNAGMAELSGNGFAGTPATVQTSLVYVDGLGKTKLAVAAFGSPTQKDILVQTDYDALFRPISSYLPVATTIGNGSFRSGTPDLSYYTSANVCATTGGNIVNGSTRTVYEASPLSRVKEQTASGVPMGSGVRQEYLTNNGNDLIY